MNAALIIDCNLVLFISVRRGSPIPIISKPGNLSRLAILNMQYKLVSFTSPEQITCFGADMPSPLKVTSPTTVASSKLIKIPI